MDFHELIQTFNTRLGLDNEINEEGIYPFEIDDLKFTIINLSENNQVAFLGDLGLPPTTEVYGFLLQSQYLFKNTNGATFSLDPDTGNIILCQVLPLQLLDANAFIALAEQFVNTLEGWSTILKNYRPEPPATSDNSSPSNAFFNNDILLV